MSTTKNKRPGLHAEITARFEQWLAKAKLQNGGKCVGFKSLHESFSEYLDGALPVTRQYFGVLMSARFLKRTSRASGRVSNVYYCLNRDPSQAE